MRVVEGTWKGVLITGVFGIVLVIMATVPMPTQEAVISRWPDGHKSAACIEFHTETAGNEELDAVTDALNSRGMDATFFVVSSYYEDQAEVLDALKDFEVANMGWRQNDWKQKLSYDQQYESIQNSDYWLKGLGFSPRGFEAPFFKSGDENTIAVLKTLGYDYDVSVGYGIYPYRINGMLEIPKAFDFDPLWSDEVANNVRVFTYFMLQWSYENDGLFAFYTHPSHVTKRMQGFEYLLDFIKARGIWVASCSEVAEWWEKMENLDLRVSGSDVVVKNNGDTEISGATVKIKPVKGVKGAVFQWNDGRAVYAVLPIIEPWGTVTLKIG